MGIGLKLDALIKERHINASELAQQVGVAPTTIYSMIKRDSKKADIDVLLKIAHVLDVDVAYFGDTPSPTENARASSTETSDLSDTPAISPDYQPSYDDVERLIARNGKYMSASQKMRLIQLLSALDIKDEG